jgi:nucleotide-binding universal stress UspA family protein
MDMVVVGVHTTRSLLGFFEGRVDRAVVEHAPCVVAVVPSGVRRLAPA